MAYDPRIHHRHTIRLPGYDYTRPGGYFVTIVTKNHGHIFGEIEAGEMRLNRCGEIASECWSVIPDRYMTVEIDEFVIMPDHVHGILIINEDDHGLPVGATHELPPPATPLLSPMEIIRRRRRKMLLPLMIGYFKMNSAKRINFLRGTPGAAVWQRNYYDHIIRNVFELSRIREYIRYNPVAWETDDENTNRRRSR
jgi:putative transposase